MTLRAAFGFTLAIAILLIHPTQNASAENGGGSQYSIGVVNIKAIFDAYQKQKDEYKKLEEARDEAQEPINKLTEQINADRDRYDAEKDTLSPEDLRDLEETIQSALTKYKAEYDRAQEDINRQENKVMRKIFEDIFIAIQEVGLKYNYHLIFDSGEANRANLPSRTGALLYHSTTLNMTQRVIDHLNSEK